MPSRFCLSASDGRAYLDTTVPLVDSLSPRRRSGERVRERGFQLATPIRWKLPLSPTLSPLVPRRERERGGFRDGGGIQMRPRSGFRRNGDVAWRSAASHPYRARALSVRA